MPRCRLYWYPGTCSRVPLVALEEVGEPFEAILEDRMGVPRPDYLAINSKGSVPTLVVGSVTVTENLAIQNYLARRYPGARLLPNGTPDIDVAVLDMQSWFSSSLHPLVRQLRFPRWYTEDAAAHPSLRASASQKLDAAFRILNVRLRKRDWLVDDWSLLDVHLLWLWFRATGSGLDGSAFPYVAAHAERCEGRPSVGRVLEREETELAALRAAGKVPDYVPDFQAGRAKVFS